VFQLKHGVLDPRRVLLACGEASGERHAIRLASELTAARPGIELSAIGGRDLEAQGVELVANVVDRAVMGLRAVLAQLPFYFRLVGRVVDWLDAKRPDLVIVIDNPGLNMIVAEQARRLGIPVLYYILPQYWAWGPWRMKRFKAAVSGAISILPFEPPIFWSAGVPTAFAGHPLLDSTPPGSSDEREPLFVIMPGSRQAEIDKHLLPMIEVFRRLRERYPEARGVIAQGDPQHVAEIRDRLKDAGVVLDQTLEVCHCEPTDVLARARLALVKSGTSSLLTAMCRTPHVVVYKLGNVLETWWAGHLVHVPFIAGPNLVAGREVVPEFCFHADATWTEVGARLLELWPDGETRNRQLTGLDEIRERLKGPGAAVEAVRWLFDAR